MISISWNVTERRSQHCNQKELEGSSVSVLGFTMQLDRRSIEDRWICALGNTLHLCLGMRTDPGLIAQGSSVVVDRNSM